MKAPRPRTSSARRGALGTNILASIKERDGEQFLTLLDTGFREAARSASAESHAQGLEVASGRGRHDSWDDELDPTALSGPALRAFFNISALWCLSDDEQVRVLGIQDTTLHTWRKRADEVCLEAETMTRISYLLGIFRSINGLLPDPSQADGWIRRRNAAPPFAGRSALARMMEGGLEDLRAIRTYLDAELNG